MDVAKFAIDHRTIIWLMIVLFVIGGIYACLHLARYEDPEFTIKEAKVITPYPGATPDEVEQEVTDRIEKAIQQLAQVKRITSRSETGVSEVTVEIRDEYHRRSLPQIWDELRRKVRDVQSELPPGAGSSVVYDDFGDVYGMLYAVTGADFSYRELKKYTEHIRKELEFIPGVAKVQLSGIREQAIYVEIARAKLAQLGISLDEIYQVLRSQNTVVEAGNVRVGDEYIVIRPSGKVDSVADISGLLLKSPMTDSLVHLDDIAQISRGYVEIPEHLVFYNDQPALLIGVSVLTGSNVVKIGQQVENTLKSLAATIPLGIQIHPIYEQPKIVSEAISGFIQNLLEALAIVIVVLLIFIGIRSGLIIASILLLTVLGTLFMMLVFHISLQRISLGALVIALGMLVDNAIVVTEGIMVKVHKGRDRLSASSAVVKQTLWPLLVATAIGILAFAAIGLSQDDTGEYTISLFYVMLISLMLSWFLAITVAPLFCYLFLKSNQGQHHQQAYQNLFYRGYRRILQPCLSYPRFSVLVLLALLGFAGWGFTYIKDGFFPNSTNPLFLIDYWRNQGTDIRATKDDLMKIQQHILQIEGVSKVTSFVGEGSLRFMLVYNPESQNSSYGQLLVSVNDYRSIDSIAQQVTQYMRNNFPNSEPKIRRIRLGPGKGAKIEARFSGPNAQILRDLAEQAKDIMRTDPNATEIRDDWRQQVKVIMPEYSEVQGRLTGISRFELSEALATVFTGVEVGVYREKDELIPIISRRPDVERINVSNLQDLQVWSPLLRKTVPLVQIAPNVSTQWENALIQRRNRKPTITASAEPIPGVEASEIFNNIKMQIEAIPLPIGYSMAWGGEYENASEAQTALLKQLPISFLSMLVILVILFNSIRQALVIWLSVPLAIIGVTIGLLLTGQPFDFMALLGFLSLTGMLIKNSVILVDQINIEVGTEKTLHQAIIDSCLSRARPVLLAAVTTVLAMIPLLTDAFFLSMAVVIMFGLTFATVLTLIVVPILYILFFSRNNHL